MRRAAKTDANQANIVGALLRCGARVQSLAAIGKGCPDLLVGINSPTAGKSLVLMEIKDGAKVPSARKLTADQIEWHAQWAGWPVHVVESVEQALAVLAGMRKGSA